MAGFLRGSEQPVPRSVAQEHLDFFRHHFYRELCYASFLEHLNQLPSALVLPHASRDGWIRTRTGGHRMYHGHVRGRDWNLSVSIFR